GERGVGSELDDFRPADFRVEPIALRLSALVTPDQRWTQHLIVLIQQDRAVHLARKADSRNIRRINFGSRDRLPHRGPGGAMPIVRVLLGPAGFWGCEGNMLAGGRAHNFTVSVGEHSAASARPDINSKQILHSFGTLISVKRDSLADATAAFRI